MEFLILAIDDCEDHCLLMASFLESFGYQCVSALDGSTALQLAQRHQPNLILLDICMPKMDGDEVLRCLKQNPQTAAIPVVAVTAMAIGTRKRFLAAGYDDYLMKPFTSEVLEAILQRHLVVSPAT
ncbi:response regulator [Pseudanabaena sp. FACHB-2040]|uniref:response regulator n=1 Tax=Pseudanabaena sp. FACHB-2040 TaxID=2692859 RepID=UPI0016869F01|nr:response regulator [Pseudanabaena sp. FACHB-2040]MBD2257406.1 response regulator [Pseudanabaena sp. FACHB-2040]